MISVWGINMRIRRAVKSVSTFVTQLLAALVKAVVTSMLVGILLFSVMHYMGVPVPSAGDLWRGVSRLAHAFG